MNLEQILILKKGGSIHIKKKNRGKFTESAKRAGMGVQEYARHVLANKDKYSSTLVKRANFARNSKKFKHEDGGILKYQNPSETLPELIQRINKKSKANFVKRLLDPNRKSIQDWVAPLNIATHKLGWATEDTKQGAFVYPEVQEINRELIDFTYPSHRRSEGINSAIERRDTVRMTPEQAKWFTENYKQYYPGFKDGGILKAQDGTEGLVTPHPLSPVGIALNQAKAIAKMKGDQQHLPPGVKEVVGPDGKKVVIRTEQPLVPLEQDLAEWLPGTGDVAEVGYIANDVKNGNLGSATLGAGLLFLPGNAGKLLKTNVGKKISNFLNKDLFNYDELWAKIKHPTWKKYAHGSDDPFFDIKNADMGYNGEVGIHMTDDIPIAEVFAKGYSGRPGKVYEFYAPKPTLETIDATDNAANIYIGNVERLAGGTFNSSNTNTFFENLLKKYGGEDVIQDIPVDNSYREDLNFMFPGTGDNLKKYTLKQDVTIPTKDEIWPNKPEHVKKQFEELGKRWNQFKIDKKDAAREVSKILSDNGHKVLKYENVQPREGLKTAYVLTDPSIIHLINPEHQFKMKHALTGLGTGLGIGYGASQLKDE